MLNERIKRARVLKAMSLQQVSDALGDISKQALSKYEKGKDTPNSTRLIQLAQVLDVKPEYFFRTTEVNLGEVEFRKHSTLGKRQQAAAKEQVKEYLERYFAVESLFDLDATRSALPLQAFPVASPADAERAAGRLRERWQLGTAPIASMTETLEENGIKVIGLDGHPRFDGLCATLREGKDAVVVSNIRRAGERQRFNLAHELGHLVMQLPAAVHGTRDEENWCHRFAGAFLFPANQVKDTFGDKRRHVLLEEYRLGKQEWRLSMLAIVRRLYDLEIITQGHYQTACKRFSILGYRKEEPDKLRPEKTHRLRQLVYRALAEGLVTPSRAAELLADSVANIEKLLLYPKAQAGNTG